MNKSKKKYYKRKTSKNKIHNRTNQRGGRAVQGYHDTVLSQASVLEPSRTGLGRVYDRVYDKVFNRKRKGYRGPIAVAEPVPVAVAEPVLYSRDYASDDTASEHATIHGTEQPTNSLSDDPAPEHSTIRGTEQHTNSLSAAPARRTGHRPHATIRGTEQPTNSLYDDRDENRPIHASTLREARAVLTRDGIVVFKGFTYVTPERGARDEMARKAWEEQQDREYYRSGPIHDHIRRRQQALANARSSPHWYAGGYKRKNRTRKHKKHKNKSKKNYKKFSKTKISRKRKMKTHRK
jgi:hypothetical protein